jgi:hypothetical protein
LRRDVALVEATRAVGYTGSFVRDPKTGRVLLDTPHAAAQAVVDGWDWTGATDPAEQLKSQAAAAVTANNTYLALASPTAAQNTAQVRRLTTQTTAVIRRLLQLMGGAT